MLGLFVGHHMARVSSGDADDHGILHLSLRFTEADAEAGFVRARSLNLMSNLFFNAACCGFVVAIGIFHHVAMRIYFGFGSDALRAWFAPTR